MENYTEFNAKTITGWIEAGWEWGTPLSHEACEKVRRGEWDMVLTPTIPVPKDWFPPMKDLKVLGLASGGGQQMPVFALLGADCTVMDLTDAQLESERLVAERENYSINIVKADMTKEFPFPNGSFDFIFHPVSNCFIEDAYHVWRECARVIKPGGIMLAGLDNGINYLFDEDDETLTVANSLPFNPLKNPAHMEKVLKADDGIQFSHTFDEQIGGQIKAGFVITGAYEDYNSGDDPTTKKGIPTFWATRAERRVTPSPAVYPDK